MSYACGCSPRAFVVAQAVQEASSAKCKFLRVPYFSSLCSDRFRVCPAGVREVSAFRQMRCQGLGFGIFGSMRCQASVAMSSALRFFVSSFGVSGRPSSAKCSFSQGIRTLRRMTGSVAQRFRSSCSSSVGVRKSFQDAHVRRVQPWHKTSSVKRNFLSDFSQWYPHALADAVSGSVAKQRVLYFWLFASSFCGDAGHAGG